MRTTSPLYDLARVLGIDPGPINEQRLIDSVCTTALSELLKEKGLNRNRDQAYSVLFSCPISGDWLDLERSESSEGAMMLTVVNRDGSIRLKHTIKTEEL